MDNISKIIGERLRSYRRKAKMSQEILAELAGVHPTYIGQLERGEKNPTIESIEKISRALELPLEELFANIIQSDKSKNEIALKCYDLIIEQDVEKQKDILEIIVKILK
ncbi:helix-turn-helix domain-containing protein [Anaerovorax odorimutans]|uniref:helix-turn-helix domain-containing protein n=1 Tax=Anaerovorax odorimutans TaxID=109327 RepID=UPI000419F4F1|nr:helix-turn-helix transcriptional regulator [Anaerovorax odorimutans]